MVDYYKATGAGGSMRIRDLGSTVELWIKAGSSITYVYSLKYYYVLNGRKINASTKYPRGGNWIKLKSFTVTKPQTIKFGISDTNTSGLGGPTHMSAWIKRGDVKVKRDGIWQNAEAYVKVAGKWYPAQPYVKYNGKWVKT